MSVILNAPAVFRWTAQANPQRHLHAAEILGADVSRAKPEDAGKILSDQLVKFMQRLKIPRGLRAVGYDDKDIPALVKGTLPQARVTKLAPRPANEDDLAHLFKESMQSW
jgi:hydroxyacid-oxoacid transhydrogenase